MPRGTNPGATDIEGYLTEHRRKDLLRFITCGSVDDGKSTLIGRLLYESKVLFEDQLAALKFDSKKFGTRDGELDYALLLDGLDAEREQGITIDVAYRYFSTEKRSFIVADAPGHEQYTRNMVTAASTADLAIILIDARKGLLAQTRRHSYLVSLIGVRHAVVAVNKMDLINYSQIVFERIEREFKLFAEMIGLSRCTFIPLSAVHGDNVITPGSHMPWYQGPTLKNLLETVKIDECQPQDLPFRMPVQWVNRPNPDFRGFMGTVASGVVRRGQRICIQPSGRASVVTRIVTADGDLEQAVAHQSITLTLADEIDVSRGDVISAADAPAPVAHQFEATLVWMNEQPLLPGRNYLMKIGATTVTATVAPLKHKVNVHTLDRIAATKLELNEIGLVGLQLDRPIAFDPYVENHEMGGFILIDRMTNDTVGAGMLHFALRRSDNIHWQALEVDKAARQVLAGHRSAIVWMTGLSGAGKST
ncbi:MAG TPA: sulfate adenylyltransferase subunit CysN, partial [Burkholderiales bacterium]|nr:sulfate adenylyltransferase subunit CysN [Burkholderiales bacterium]